MTPSMLLHKLDSGNVFLHHYPRQGWILIGAAGLLDSPLMEAVQRHLAQLAAIQRGRCRCPETDSIELPADHWARIIRPINNLEIIRAGGHQTWITLGQAPPHGCHKSAPRTTQPPSAWPKRTGVAPRGPSGQTDVFEVKR